MTFLDEALIEILLHPKKSQWLTRSLAISSLTALAWVEAKDLIRVSIRHQVTILLETCSIAGY